MKRYRLTKRESKLFDRLKEMDREELYLTCVKLTGLYSGAIGDRDQAIDMIEALL